MTLELKVVMATVTAMAMVTAMVMENTVTDIIPMKNNH
jgi:hypothetical protein